MLQQHLLDTHTTWGSFYTQAGGGGGGNRAVCPAGETRWGGLDTLPQAGRQAGGTPCPQHWGGEGGAAFVLYIKKGEGEGPQ